MRRWLFSTTALAASGFACAAYAGPLPCAPGTGPGTCAPNAATTSALSSLGGTVASNTSSITAETARATAAEAAKISTSQLGQAGGPAIVYVTNRPPTPNDDGSGLSNHGPCSAYTNAPALWGYLDAQNAPHVYEATSCTQGATSWVPMPFAGLPLDLGISGLHGHGVLQLSSSATAAVDITDSNGNTLTNVGFRPGRPVINMDTVLAWSAAHPTPCAAIPNCVSGGDYEPAPIINVAYDQSGGGWNSVAVSGVLLGTATAESGTYTTNKNITLGVTTTGTVVQAPVINEYFSGGTLVPLSYGSNTNMYSFGEITGTPSATATQTAYSGTQTTSSTWSLTYYNEDPVIPLDNGSSIPSMDFNSTDNGIGNQQISARGLYIPNGSLTLSSSSWMFIGGMPASSQLNTAGLIEVPTGGTIVGATDFYVGQNDHLYINGNNGNCPVAFSSSTDIYMWTQSAGTLTCQSGNAYGSTTGATTFTASTGFNIGALKNNGWTSRMNVSAVLECACVWTPAQQLALRVSALYLELKNAAPPPQYDAMVLTQFDSLGTTGDTQTGGDPPLWMQQYIRPAKWYNVSKHGQALFDDDSPATYGSGTAVGAVPFILANRFDPTVDTYWYEMMGGNDINNLLTASLTVANLEAAYLYEINLLKSAPYINNKGKTIHFIAAPIRPGCSSYNVSPANLPMAESFNAWITSMAFIPQSAGGLGLVQGYDNVDYWMLNPVLNPGTTWTPGTNTYGLTITVPGTSTIVTQPGASNAPGTLTLTASLFCNYPTASATDSTPTGGSADGLHPEKKLAQLLAAAWTIPVKAVLP